VLGIDLAYGRDRWEALVNTVLNLQVSYNVGNFVSSWEIVSFSNGTLSMWHLV
jgi:hypothetical protein